MHGKAIVAHEHVALLHGDGHGVLPGDFAEVRDNLVFDRGAVTVGVPDGEAVESFREILLHKVGVGVGVEGFVVSLDLVEPNLLAGDGVNVDGADVLPVPFSKCN